MKDKKTPNWLKKLTKLLDASDASERKELKKVLAKLKRKSELLKAEMMCAQSEKERERLKQKWLLVNKHHKKGIKKLAEMKK